MLGDAYDLGVELSLSWGSLGGWGVPYFPLPCCGPDCLAGRFFPAPSALLLCPQGKNKAGDVKAAAEKTLTDRKRERRKRKLQKRMRLQEKEKRRRALEKSHPEQAGRVTKAAAAQKLQQLTKTGRAALLKVRAPRGLQGHLHCPSQPDLGGIWSSPLPPAPGHVSRPADSRAKVRVFVVAG